MNLRRLLYLMPFLLTLFIIPLSLISIDKPVGDAIGELREASQETEEIPRWSYLFTQFRVIVTYIRLLFLPINQNLDYDYPIYLSFFEPNVFLSFLFLLFILCFGVYLLYRSGRRYYQRPSRFTSINPPASPDNPPPPPFRKGGMGGFESEGQGGIVSDSRLSTLNLRLISFGIFWFFITLSVESSIIPIKDVIFEHRLYLPSIGAIIAFSAAVFRVFHRATEQQSNRAVVKGKTAVLLHYCSAALIVIALSIATYQRNIVWQDEMSLWKDVVRKSPEKARGYNGVGIAYYNKGLVDEAIEHYQIALRLKPDNADFHNNLGNAYYNKGLVDEAIEHYQIAIRLKPDDADFHYNLGNAYDDKGLVDEAIEHYQIAIRLKPDNADFHNNLGIAYKAKGLPDKAIEHYQIALNLKPDGSFIHFNLGIIYLENGFTDKARNEFVKALQINPTENQARQMLNSISTQNKTPNP